MKKILLIVIWSQTVIAQELPNILLEYLEEEEISQNQLTYLEELYHQPLNLNHCSFEELLQLPFMNTSEIKAIISYRKTKGYFRSVYELQAIPQLKSSTINLLIGLVSVGDIVPHQKNLKQQLVVLYQSILQDQKEFLNKDYVGSKYKACLRYRGEIKQLNWGLLTEKDAGENVLDFNSLYLHIKNTNTQYFIGDYQLSLGQGLLHHQGFSLGKSSNVMGTFKNNKSLRPHTSSRETHFMRGVAIHQRFEKWSISSWYSNLFLDASLNQDHQTISSIYDSGLHRTTSEIDNRNRLHQHSAGAKIDHTSKNFRTALYSIANYWDKKVVLGNDTLEKHWGIGYDYSLTLKNTHFFGEIAYLNKSAAYLFGLSVQLDSRLSFSTIYRNYLWNFYALESNAFSEQSNVRNEKGFYAALQMDINSNWQWSCYADMYHFPKSSYYSNSPVRGRDYLVQLNYRLDKFYNSYLRIKNENKTIEVYHDVGLKKIENLYQYSIQFQNQYSISDFVFKNRLVWNTFQNEMGYLLLQDLAYRPLNKKWSFSLRYVLFDTPSYSSRIYAYEPDVLYSFSVPIHYGEGQKLVALLSYKMKSKLTINFKYAQTQYFDQTPIRGGSIEGQLYSEFKILLKQVF